METGHSGWGTRKSRPARDVEWWEEARKIERRGDKRRQISHTPINHTVMATEELIQIHSFIIKFSLFCGSEWGIYCCNIGGVWGVGGSRGGRIREQGTTKGSAEHMEA
jgi:hypothetical protein